MIALLSASAICGCSTIPGEQMSYEIGYQALHAVDTMQTLDFKKRGWIENNPLLGRHPSDSEIIAYMAAESVSHMLITKTLAERHAPMWLQRMWHYLSISWNGALVIGNAHHSL
jgi:hypothetical protein